MTIQAFGTEKQEPEIQTAWNKAKREIRYLALNSAALLLSGCGGAINFASGQRVFGSIQIGIGVMTAIGAAVLGCPNRPMRLDCFLDLDNMV